MSYSRDVADSVLAELAAGRTLREICREGWAPNRETVRRWIAIDADGFAGRYSVAREAGLETARSFFAAQPVRDRNDEGCGHTKALPARCSWL